MTDQTMRGSDEYGDDDDQDDDDQDDDEKFWAGDIDATAGWSGRVTFQRLANGRTVAFRPTDLLVPMGRADEAEEFLRSRRWAERFRRDERDTVGMHARFLDVPDPIRAVTELRLHTGISAQPNHVLFLHCGSFCPPHPAWRFACGYGSGGAYGGRTGFNPAEINPAEINPAEINPAEINPAEINPAEINPAEINPAEINAIARRRLTGVRRSSARPARPPEDKRTRVEYTAPQVFVLDTGLAKKDHGPAGLSASQFRGRRVDVPDFDGDLLVDVAAGHGTFIAGVIHRLAPDVDITVRRVASVYGDVTESYVAQKLRRLTERANAHTILSLSFGGYAYDDDAAVLAEAISEFQDTGGVVVASAGNDGSCCPTYPAALPGVVSVGALGPSGPATFTNYGPWVRACAPGVDLLNMFFHYNGSMGSGGGLPDPDDYTGCALWSGTSFAAPVVAGALTRMMVSAKITAAQAVERIIDAPELFRFPDLGTVVNVI